MGHEVGFRCDLSGNVACSEIGTYCPGDGVAYTCPTGSQSVSGFTSVSDCLCIAGYFGDFGAGCSICPKGVYCPGDGLTYSCEDANAFTTVTGTSSATSCECRVGYGQIGTTSDGGALCEREWCEAGFYDLDGYICAPCPEDSYCPGDNVPHKCPGDGVILHIPGRASLVECALCGNGVLEAGEECDDFNRVDGDGCSGTCKFEDACGCASGDNFICSVQNLSKSVCCPSLVNPFSGENVCSCLGLSSGTPYLKLKSDCTVLDVDECASDSSCAENAICENQYGKEALCVCPPGLNGDGYSRCNIFVYKTTTKFVADVSEFVEFDWTFESLYEMFLRRGVIPADTPFEDVTFQITFLGGENQRRLLQSEQVEIVVDVISDNEEENANVSETLTEENLNTAFEEELNSSLTFIQSPSNVVESVDTVYGAVQATLSGLKIVDLEYDPLSFEWQVSVNFKNGDARTLLSLYTSKQNAFMEDTFFLSKHPCMQDSSICCLLAYRDRYNVGSFGTHIGEEIGQCGSDVAGRDTSTFFGNVSDVNNEILGTLFDDYGGSSITVNRESGVATLRFGRIDLRNSFSYKQPFAGGWNLQIFVGMTYITLLPTNAISTTASQTNIFVSETDSVSFATTSAQDYSFVSYVTMGVYSTRFVKDLFSLHEMQYVRVSFVVPSGSSQNMQTGVIPLNSIRFKIAKTGDAESSAWVNPCFAKDGSGLYDDSAVHTLYDEASFQTCANQPPLCQNPTSVSFESGLVNFYFPIGDGAIDETILSSLDEYSIFVYHDVSIRLSSGRLVLKKLFMNARLSSLGLNKECESLNTRAHVEDVVTLDVAVGFNGGFATLDDITTVRVDDLLGIYFCLLFV